MKPCNRMPIALGNVFIDSICEVWNNSGVLKKFANVSYKTCNECMSCEIIEFCVRCHVLEFIILTNTWKGAMMKKHILTIKWYMLGNVLFLILGGITLAFLPIAARLAMKVFETCIWRLSVDLVHFSLKGQPSQLSHS